MRGGQAIQSVLPDMARVRSFGPIASHDAEVLILGSMPGRASLAAGQYYAHPRNAFWPIISELLQFDAASAYKIRVQALKSARIALWDVLESCTRRGSLDAMIDDDTLAANDFQAFFRAHQEIRRVYFNGVKAEACYRRHVLPGVASAPIFYSRLPSTSPANASLSFARKLCAWQVILRSKSQRTSSMKATSSQRPNLNPTSRRHPARLKPKRS